jgi:hypothetical protein
MSGRRWRVALGTVLTIALISLPIILVLGLINWRIWASGPDRNEARSLFESRGREVAGAWAAWAASPDSAAHTGFAPLQDLTLPQATISQYSYENVFDTYQASATLPTERPGPGLIRFPDGDTMTVPLVTAGEAVSALGNPDCASSETKPSGARCVASTVTAARLSAAQVQTGRGLAIVPVWLFTVIGQPGPVVRVAVAPEAIGSPSTPVLPPTNPRLNIVVSSPLRIDEVKDDTVRLWFVPHCAPTVGLVIHETADVVVLGIQSERSGGCVPELYPERITATLSRPLGSRLLLGVDGKPIPQSGRTVDG